MKQTINRTAFHDAFINMGRKEQFSYEARNALFDYLEEYEDSTGEEIELDVIGLCCDYTEAKVSEVLADYSLSSLEDIQDRTTVIVVDDSDEDEKNHVIIYENF
jgi:hypothetical protein